MLDREIATAGCVIHTKQINILCRQNVEFLKDKLSGTYIDHWVLVYSWVY